MQVRRYDGWASAMLLLLGGCGGGESSSAPGVATVSATPSPTPLPSPTPTPTPTPTPLPTPTATAVEPYTLGTLGYTLAADIPADKLPAIRDAMDFAVGHANTLGAFAGTVNVVYGAQTPTADASYRGTIRFGGSIGRRVALHELAHWLGSGSTGAWARTVVGGRFTGAKAVARIKAFDGPDAILNADGQHFWPYGLNYDGETSETQRNTQLVSAQVADMGLGDDATAAIAGTRRFQNRSSTNILQSGTELPAQGTPADGSAQQWRVGFADGFVTLASAADDRRITARARGDDASATLSAATATADQQWEMLPAGDGWFLLRNRATGNCLDNIGNLAPGAAIRLWSCGFHPNQQWRLIR